MFIILAIVYLMIDVIAPTLLGDIGEWTQWNMQQAQIAMLAVLGWMSAKSASPKRTAVMTVLMVQSVWILCTDWAISYVPEAISVSEGAVFFALLVWAFMRPYEYKSDQLTTDTVCLLFYKANGGSFLMHVFGVLGLPVSSMSVVAGEYWLKLVRGKAYLQKDLSVCINESRYIIVDTGIPVSEHIHGLFNMLRNEPARTPMSLWLRLRCIASIKPLLRELGDYYVPRNIFEQIPAIYFYKFTGDRRG